LAPVDDPDHWRFAMTIPTRWNQVASGFAMPEAPLWDPDDGCLLLSDVMAGGVYRVRGGAVDVVVPHRRGVGGLARHVAGGLVVAGKNLAWKVDGATSVIARPRGESPTVRFNDLTVSPAGRLLVGSIDAEPGGKVHATGELYLVDLDGSVRIVSGDISKTNGLGYSPDGHSLYHVDTGRQMIWRHSVSADDGDIDSDRSPLIRFSDGHPDGLAVASDGSIWVAVADRNGAGYIAVLSPDGDVDTWIPAPDRHVTSLCFGGEDLRTVYVTLGATKDRASRSGRVVSFRARVGGLPRPPARVPVDHDGR
jgi:D-xylonolactonase